MFPLLPSPCPKICSYSNSPCHIFSHLILRTISFTPAPCSLSARFVTCGRKGGRGKGSGTFSWKLHSAAITVLDLLLCSKLRQSPPGARVWVLFLGVLDLGGRRFGRRSRLISIQNIRYLILWSLCSSPQIWPPDMSAYWGICWRAGGA